MKHLSLVTLLLVCGSTILANPIEKNGEVATDLLRDIEKKLSNVRNIIQNEERDKDASREDTMNADEQEEIIEDGQYDDMLYNAEDEIKHVQDSYKEAYLEEQKRNKELQDDMDALSKLEKDNEKLQDESEEDYEEEINDEESE